MPNPSPVASVRVPPLILAAFDAEIDRVNSDPERFPKMTRSELLVSYTMQWIANLQQCREGQQNPAKAKKPAKRAPKRKAK